METMTLNPSEIKEKIDNGLSLKIGKKGRETVIHIGDKIYFYEISLIEDNDIHLYVSSEEVSGFNILYTQRDGMMVKILMKSGSRIDSSTFKYISMSMFEAKKLADYHARKLYGERYESKGWINDEKNPDKSHSVWTLKDKYK